MRQTTRQLARLKESTLTLLVVASAAAQVPPAFAESGQATVQKLVQVLSTWNGSPTDKGTYYRAAQYIDYDGMAKRSLSSAEWSKLSASQKSQFTATMRTLIEQRYYVRWHKIFRKGKLAYTGESNSGGNDVVKSQLTLGKKVDPLDWTLSNDKVISLSVGKNDLLNKLSTRLQGRLDKLGFDGLLSWMKTKANIRPDDSSEANSTNSN